MYFEKDQARGIPATFLWLTEEIGELASALRETEHAQAQANQKPSDVAIGKDLAAKRKNLGEEFADVFAWLATIANVAEIDLSNVLTTVQAARDVKILFASAQMKKSRSHDTVYVA